MDCHFSIFLKVSHSIKKAGNPKKKRGIFIKIKKIHPDFKFFEGLTFLFLFIHIAMHPLDSSLPPSLQGKVQKIYR